MNKSFKIAAYIILSIVAVTFGYMMYKNYSSAMNEAPEMDTSAEMPAAEQRAKPAVEGASGFSQSLVWGGLFVVSVLILGTMVGHDVSQWVSAKFLKAAYDDEGQIGDPDYEVAEQQWADGQFLEAIRLMREYLNRNPREQHVALRIAEIYEKDLQNHLAAALEYEEVLKKKLPSERWGWAAIHLCNLYFKLNQPDKAVILLRRIEAEHPETAAAEKARKRLALYDSGGTPTEEEQAGGI